MKIRHTILLAPIGALALAGCGGGDSGGVPSNAVAVINKCDSSVTKNDFNQLLGQAKASYQGQKQKFPGAGTQEYKAVQNQIVSYLVLRQGYVCEGEELGVKVSDGEIDKRLDQLVQQYYKGNEDKFKAELKKQGVAEEQLRKELQQQVYQRKIFDKVTSDLKVTDKELRDYYEKNKAQYTNAATRTVRHILVKDRALAERLLQQLRGGANFAALARKHSTDPGSKKRGGKLDLAQGQTVPAFDKVAFKLKKNEISDLVKTQFGWHMIQALTPVKAANTSKFPDVRDQIREIVLQSKKTTEGQKWSDGFRKDLQKPGAVDYQVGFKPPPQQTTTARTNGATTAAP
ncbi:MAG: peptidylprolyl isomerase [Gaiellaceae bacterium]